MSSKVQALQAGTARVEITPPVGVDLAGYVARAGPSTGVHDALYARALVLDDGASRAVLIVCDLVGLSYAFVTAARRRITGLTGIPEAAVMITCTHTHSGPATLVLNECGTPDPGYLATLQDRIAAAAQQAAAALTPVEVGAAWGAFPEGLFNRRRDGQPVDPRMGAACLRTGAGEILAVLATYGCHPVVLDADNRLISADYPGVLTRALERALGGAAFFLTGACGNVDPVRRGSFEYTQWLGEHLANEALAALDGIVYNEARPLLVARTPLDLPLAEVQSAEAYSAAIAQHRQLLEQAEPGSAEARIHQAMLTWAESTLAQVVAGRVPAAVDAEVQLIKIGSLAIIGVPGELFSSLGTQIPIRSAAAPVDVFVAGYANGDVGYIPDAAAYAVGGYEVTDAYKYYNYPAALHAEAGHSIVAAAQQLLGWSETIPRRQG